MREFRSCFLLAQQNCFVPSELKSYLGNEYSSSFKCIHLNIRSARKKVQLGLFFDEFCFLVDVINVIRDVVY